jgi:hypothetical protein
VARRGSTASALACVLGNEVMHCGATQLGEHLRDTRQLTRGVAPSGNPLGGNIGRVSFQNDRLGRQTRSQCANALTAGISQRAAESEFEAEFDKFIGLLPAAIKGMGNAADHTHLAQLRQDLIDGPAHV